MTGCCNFWKQEFKKDMFLLSYEHPQAFGISQAGHSQDKTPNKNCGQPSIVYLIWRTVLMLFTLIFQVVDIITQETTVRQQLYFTKLTHWSFLLLTIHMFLLWMTSVVHFTKVRKGELDTKNMHVLSKVAWVFHNVTVDTAPIVTLLYWLLFWNETIDIKFGNVTTHAVNTALVVLDLFICAVPVRLLHCWHAMLYAVCYGIFTVIYWAAGGTDSNGNPYIYSALNWNSPTMASALFLGLTFVAVPLVHFITFLLYRLRLCIYMSCKKHDGKIEDSSVST